MSVIKELREKPESSINLIDILVLICPEGKTKYVETLLRIMKSTENIEEYKQEVIQRLESDYGIDRKELKGYSAIQIIHIEKFIKDMFAVKDLENFRNFCEYNERGLIEENDVSRYTTFEQVTKAVNIAQLKLNEKEMEKQVLKVYEDDEWLVLKPLTFEASKKYGSNTKWCTTTETEPQHFDRYGKGILIYSINKKTNYKVATYKDLSGVELSFWNQTDQKIDSLDSELPMSILKIIKDDVKVCKSSNLSQYKGPKQTSPFMRKTPSGTTF
jgi:hypothetical protein